MIKSKYKQYADKKLLILVMKVSPKMLINDFIANIAEKLLNIKNQKSSNNKLPKSTWY